MILKIFPQNKEIYLKFLHKLERAIEEHNKNISLENIKIMRDFEIKLRSEIKKLLNSLYKAAIFIIANLYGKKWKN